MGEVLDLIKEEGIREIIRRLDEYVGEFEQLEYIPVKRYEDEFRDWGD